VYGPDPMAKPATPASSLRAAAAKLAASAASARTEEKRLLDLLDAITSLLAATDDARDTLDDAGRLATAKALQAGLDPALLRDRPYGDRKLRAIARELGLPPRRPGPAPRRRALSDLLDDDRT
jgi:hypothetical protein